LASILLQSDNEFNKQKKGVGRLVSGIYKLIDCSLVQQLKFETVSNNLANLNTSGFKKNILSFDQALAGSYVSSTDFAPGPVKYTGNTLDVALGTDGFFKVETAKGIRYTRNGAFSIDSKGYLITRTGDRVVGDNGPVKVGGGDVTIGRDGQVSVNRKPVGTLTVVDFKDRRLLKQDGASFYHYQGGEEDIVTPEEIDVQQEYLESSNVNPTEAMIKIVEAFRGFEAAQKAIQSIDEITSKMVNDYGLLQ